MPTNDHTTSEDEISLKAKDKARRRAYYEANREACIARTKAYYKANKESTLIKARANAKARYDADKEIIKKKVLDYQQANREKILDRKRIYRRKNKDQISSYNKMQKVRKYGLTAEEYLEMLASCKGRCPCCKTPFSTIISKTASPCIDHCHKTGKCKEGVRGIVCSRCNLVLGHAGDSPKILRACARYLEGKKT